MALEPVRLADTREWLRRALDDLRGAEIDLAATPPLLRDALFHAQQAVENALKGYLTWHDRPFRKTHDLRYLGEQCIELDQTLSPSVEGAFYLSDYAWKFRYPGSVEEPARDHAREKARVVRV